MPLRNYNAKGDHSVYTDHRVFSHHATRRESTKCPMCGRQGWKDTSLWEMSSVSNGVYYPVFCLHCEWTWKICEYPPRHGALVFFPRATCEPKPKVEEE